MSKSSKKILLALFCVTIIASVSKTCHGSAAKTPEEIRCEAILGNAEIIKGTVGVAGQFKNVKKASLCWYVEANHIPPLDCIRKTDNKSFKIHESFLPAVSTEYPAHRNAGTTGSSNSAKLVRNAITNFLNDGDIKSALAVQILFDYALNTRNDFQRSYDSLEHLMDVLTCIYTTQGEPFLSMEDRDEMLNWLNAVNNLYVDSRRAVGPNVNDINVINRFNLDMMAIQSMLRDFNMDRLDQQLLRMLSLPEFPKNSIFNRNN
ncbi:hypothetical protein HOLleu_26952 [Holothuria leucospilota]|uniref:Uncharacterized protein n=1 Tax=Holothuria leucospilota TaxID=206669 RepID=A0A9Q1H2D2_HOLLE|nr:hypothetical protein HOLleu_26952 [Holothuria leucospilota]